MSEITRFSLLFDIPEDRLALDTVDAAGATTRLWLTQRLCRGLVKALVSMLPHGADRPLAAPEAATLQSWEQAAAMAGFGETPSVRAGPEAPRGLVQAVNIVPADGRLVLTFDFGGGQSRVIGLAPAALRQTLAVMHGLYVEAGWPLDLWPGWIADPATPAAAGLAN